MPQVDRTQGGLVTCRSGQWTSVILSPTVTYWLIDLGYDSAGAAQTSAKLFYNTSGKELNVGFTEESGVGYVRQSSATFVPAIPISGISLLQLAASGAETTAMLVVDPPRR